MSKPSLDSLVGRKGAAAPAALGFEEPSKEGTREPGNEVSKPVQPTQPAARRRPWDGLNEPVKGNFEVNTRLLAKLTWLKSAKQIRTQKDFVLEVLEREADKLIAKAEREGY